MDARIRADELGPQHLGKQVEIRPGVVVWLDRIEYTGTGPRLDTVKVRVKGSSNTAPLEPWWKVTVIGMPDPPLNGDLELSW